jgi:Electron transfer flavoprotein, beta subunit
MKIVACFKVVRDERDLVVAPDRTVTLDAGGLRVGDYDLNAIEAGAQLAADGGELIALTVGGEEVRDSKLRKSVLSRGVGSLTSVVDPGLTTADAAGTAEVLAAAITRIDGAELVLCGEGSADRYAQQVGAQLAARLGLPYLNAVSKIEVSADGLVVERTLDGVVETLAVPLPAVLSVTSDLNSPRIPTMKDILGAGKKPATDGSLADLGVALPVPAAVAGPERAPQSRQRAGTVYETAHQQEFFDALRRLIGKDAK